MTNNASVESDHRRVHPRLSDPAQIAAALPYLLGFHPKESLVFLWLKNNELVVAQRADLCQDIPLDEYAHAFCAPGSNVPADSVVGVCISREAAGWETMWKALDDQCPVPIRARLHVRGSRVTPIDPEGRMSGPWRWIGVRERDAAARDFPGQTPERDRDRLQREVEHHADTATIGASTSDVPTWVDLASMLARQPFVCSPRLLANAARERRGRDLILWCAARMDEAERRSLLEGLLSALRSTPDGEGAHLAAATSVVAWLCGDGARANVAVERCLAEDPDSTMGALIDQTIAHAIPPAQVRAMFVDTPFSVLGLAEGLLDADFTRRYSPA